MLLRHAKSSWGAPTLSDHERPLSPRGERAAAAMGMYLARSEPAPDVILCSSARRTRETLDTVRARLSGAPRVSVEDALYGASPD